MERSYLCRIPHGLLNVPQLCAGGLWWPACCPRYLCRSCDIFATLLPFPSFLLLSCCLYFEVAEAEGRLTKQLKTRALMLGFSAFAVVSPVRHRALLQHALLQSSPMHAAVIKRESNLTPALGHSRKRCAEGMGGTEQSQRLRAFPGALERLREMTAPIKTLQFTRGQKKPA